MTIARGTDRFGIHRRLRVLPLALLLGCESADCTLIPCAPPTAIQLTVRAAESGNSIDATIALSGVWTTTFTCSGACTISGPPGTYILDVSAPGYMTLHQTVKVEGTAAPSCGCAEADAKLVSLTLVAASN